ncbi:MAG: hypothetical protein CL402_04185 [Acidiferrobacteraceae bacterium]|nr:hypothetical protein [Acidiferrobacteraceae bacterium]|tara:strand:+ start:487 stop:720 length:234 start_codon:yes stop_codon:yes gene_type:complete
MTNQHSKPMNIDTGIEVISDRAEKLIKLVKRLQADNHQMRIHQEQLTIEKTELQDRNREAKSRIDQIVERLRQLEEE